MQSYTAFFGRDQSMKRFIFLILLSGNLSAAVDWSHNASCPSPDMQRVELILNNMTLREKVGQIIIPDIDAVTGRKD